MQAPPIAGKKIVGLPVWVWALAIGGGIIVGVYMRRRAAGTSASDTTATDASGSDMSGTASGDSANSPDFSGIDGSGGGGFNNAPPPAAPPANARLDPAQAAELRKLLALEEAERNAKKNQKTRKRTKPKRPPGGGLEAFPGGNPAGPPRVATTHFPQDNRITIHG